MKAFFTHIAEGTLTEDILMSFIVAGCDMDAVNNSLKTTPLIYAYKKKKYDMVKFLLDNGADVSIRDANDNTIADLARKDNSVIVLLMLMKHKARCNAIKLQKIQKNPEKYDEKVQQLVKTDSDDLDNNKEADIRATIKTIIAADSELQKYSQLQTVVDSITSLEYTIDLTGGNADDKYEAATIELVTTAATHYLEYFYWYNWSYDEAGLMLEWRTGEKTESLWDIKNKKQESLSVVQKETVCSLAAALGLKDMPFEDFVRFLTVLLSRIVQKKLLEIEEHGIYLRLSLD